MVQPACARLDCINESRYLFLSELGLCLGSGLSLGARDPLLWTPKRKMHPLPTHGYVMY